MTATTPAIEMHCPRRRATAILGLVALALLQVSIAAHQFEHSADHGFNVCHACTAYSQLENAPHAGATPVDFGFGEYAVPAARNRLLTPANVTATCQPRAPPYS